MAVLRLFLSHSHYDNLFCQRLRSYLEEHLSDIDIFFDEEELIGGDEWLRRIPHEVITRPFFVVILSSHAVEAAWVREETNLALREAVKDPVRRVIPVRYQDCDVNRLTPLLQNRQIIDCAFQPEEVGLAQLLAALHDPASLATKEDIPEYERIRIHAQDEFLAGRWRMAAKMAEFALTFTANERDAALWGEYGLALITLGEWQQGAEKLKRAVEINRFRTDLWRARASTLAQHHLVDEALTAWDAALITTNAPEGKLEILMQIYHGLLEQQRWQQALLILDQSLEIAPDSAQLWGWRGNTLKELGQPAEALAAYRHAAALDYHSLDVGWQDGLDLPDLSQDEALVSLYEQRGESNFQGPDLDGVITTLDDITRYEALESAYTALLERDPENIARWFARGRILCFLKRYEDALAIFQRMVHHDSAYSMPTQFSMGLLLVQLGRFEEAVALLDAVTTVQNDHIPAWLNKGLALYRLGRYREAVRAYRHATELDFMTIEAWRKLGFLLCLLGAFKEALMAYDNALWLDPHDEFAQQQKHITETKLKERQTGTLGTGE